MINKPEAATATAVAMIASTSPLAGDYVVMLLAALLGALVAVSKIEADTQWRRWEGAKYVFRSVAIAFSFTWLTVLFVSRKFDQDISTLLWPVAFAMGWVGDGWIRIKDIFLARIVKHVSKE